MQCDIRELYALDALEEAERATYSKHLETCGACRAAMPGLLETVGGLALAVTPVAPPARLRMQILAIPAQVEQEASGANAPVLASRRMPRWGRLGVVAASLALAFTLGLSVESFRIQAESPGPTVAATAASTLDRIEASADYAQVSRKAKGGGKVAMAYSSSLNRAVITAQGLPQLNEGEMYQVWYRNASEKMVPVGSFTTAEDATLSLDGNLSTTSAVGITREPQGEATVPTSNPLIFINL